MAKRTQDASDSEDGRGRLRPLDQGSLSERVYDTLRRSIISGRFAPGERLIENTLAEDLGVSRAPVREAFRKLAAEQLVEERPRYGTYVREFTAKDFVDTYNLISAVESLAVRLMVRQQGSLDELHRIAEKMTEAAAQGDLHRVVEVEVEFHRKLCSSAGNHQLDNVFRLLSGMVGMALSLDDATYEDISLIAAEHYSLLDALSKAINTGREEHAVFALRSHIRASLDDVMGRLGGEPSEVLYPLVYPGDLE